MALARFVLRTSNTRCFPVSGLATAGLEALLNTLIEGGDQVAVVGGTHFVAETHDIAARLGVDVDRRCTAASFRRLAGRQSASSSLTTT